jgi:hypothetical protein
MTLESKLRLSILLNMPAPKIDAWEMEQLEKELGLLGYDLEVLERDNPYNQWMYNE